VSKTVRNKRTSKRPPGSRPGCPADPGGTIAGRVHYERRGRAGAGSGAKKKQRRRGSYCLEKKVPEERRKVRKARKFKPNIKKVEELKKESDHLEGESEC